MNLSDNKKAIIAQSSALAIKLSGLWNVQNLQDIESQLDSIQVAPHKNITIDCTLIIAMDTGGAIMFQKLLQRFKNQKTTVSLLGLQPKIKKTIDAIGEYQIIFENHDVSFTTRLQKPPILLKLITQIGISTVVIITQLAELLEFIGQTAAAFAKSIMQPKRIRWRPILFNIRTAGFDALPIVGLLSFLMGIVLAYQGADQLRQYGANIFVVDLIGLSMLREFAPLMTAIIIAGRSGSAYAAQIGTMAVTEEIDAMRTLGISPQELLVLPKVIALIIALPLLTVFADMLGIFGGMLMARQQLDVGFTEFFDRFAKAISPTAFMIGIGKAPVFAAIIAMVGCFQGFRTKGGADSVGIQTTRSVVQAIFLVIVADALFSIAFSMLDL